MRNVIAAENKGMNISAKLPSPDIPELSPVNAGSSSADFTPTPLRNSVISLKNSAR